MQQPSNGVAEMHVKSSWHAETKRNAVLCQTVAVAYLESEAQTDVSALQLSEKLDKGEGIDSRSLVPSGAQLAGSGFVYPGDHHTDETVLQFLQSVYKDLLTELQSNSKSSAFDNYDPAWKEKNEDIGLAAAFQPAMAVEREWHATQLSWNSNGTAIAVAYGRTDTVAWCHGKGFAGVWQVGQEDETKPFMTLEADAYFTAVAFHPTRAVSLAAGTYNGEILLYNISDANAKPISSVNFSLGPREPILRLKWLANLREQRESHKYVLCSGSADGKILFWSPTNKFQEAISGYEVQNKKRVLVGVQSMSFVTGADGTMNSGKRNVPGVENLMLLGLESGDVFRTKPGNSMAAQQAGAGLGVLEVDHFDPHLGPVHSVDCSPFFRNLFLTCSSDGSVRLYSTLERTPLISLEPSQETKHYLYEARFSPCRPSVLAAVSRASHLHIYDLSQSRTSPVTTVDAGFDGTPVLCLCFNPSDPSLLATGDAKGTVRLWRLSSNLTDASDLERQAVRFSESKVEKEIQTNPIRQLFGFSF